MMSCPHTSAASNGYKYSHEETATIRLSRSSAGSLNSRVLIESTSQFQSNTPLFHIVEGSWSLSEGALASSTPFSKQVLELISRYPMQRLLIRVGDAAAASSSGGIIIEHTNPGQTIDEQQLLQEERSRGPSGTSVAASFVQSPSNTTHQRNHNDNMRTKEYYQNQYASLLRYLLDRKLFPPCGAPLDSLRVRKHGHSTIVHSPGTERSAPQNTVNVESSLAADAATFCNTGIYSFLLSKREGWGAAADNGACHFSDNWGLFSALFSSSSGVLLSELLLGTSLDATPWEHRGHGGSNKRNSVWIDLQVSPSCFARAGDSNRTEECLVKVTRGASYRIALPYSTGEESHSKQSQTLNLSLGNLLLGHNTLEHSLSSKEDGQKAWYPCPLSDSSRILLYLPTGYGATLMGDGDKISTGFDGDIQKGKVELNVLGLKDGYVDLTATWAQLHRGSAQEEASALSPSLFGISRTVQRPLGVSSSGTLVTVLRYNQLEESQVVKVDCLDVLPGTLVKPRMNTLRMLLYQGGGAGGHRFVPPVVNSDDHPCGCLNETHQSNTFDASSSNQCGSIFCAHIGLSDLQDHKLILHSDGTILLERTINLQPDSSLWMMVDFDEAYLPFQKFPADANRGVDAFPSRATFTPVTMTSRTTTMPSITLYSPSLLLLPPVPDMSMPFNVISLSCTLWAFVLGSLLNILVRRGTESVKRELTGEKEKRPLDKLKEKVKRLMEKLKRVKPRGKKAV